MSSKTGGIPHHPAHVYRPGAPAHRAVLFTGIAALASRALLLPVLPIRQPIVTDEYSYLLAADTFAAGRLTNPTHPMWVHFESMHILERPTYAAMHHAAQGVILAAGQVLAGHPWAGVYVSVAVMCAPALLDVAGVAASCMGAARRSAGGGPAGPFRLLDQQLLGRSGGGHRRSAGAWARCRDCCADCACAMPCCWPAAWRFWPTAGLTKGCCSVSRCASILQCGC